MELPHLVKNLVVLKGNLLRLARDRPFLVVEEVAHLGVELISVARLVPAVGAVRIGSPCLRLGVPAHARRGALALGKM